MYFGMNEDLWALWGIDLHQNALFRICSSCVYEGMLGIINDNSCALRRSLSPKT